MNSLVAMSLLIVAPFTVVVNFRLLFIVVSLRSFFGNEVRNIAVNRDLKSTVRYRKLLVEKF